MFNVLHITWLCLQWARAKVVNIRQSQSPCKHMHNTCIMYNYTMYMKSSVVFNVPLFNVDLPSPPSGTSGVDAARPIDGVNLFSPRYLRQCPPNGMTRFS